MDKYEEFISCCKELADELRTIFEAKRYDRYGWVSLSFMTDKFGGIYVHLHYDLNTNRVVNWYGFEKATEIKCKEQLRELVITERNKMLQNRDFEALSERINEEY